MEAEIGAGAVEGTAGTEIGTAEEAVETAEEVMGAETGIGAGADTGATGKIGAR